MGGKKSPSPAKIFPELLLVFLASLAAVVVLDSTLLSSVDQSRRRLSNRELNTGTIVFSSGKDLMAFPFRFTELAGLWRGPRLLRETRDDGLVQHFLSVVDLLGLVSPRRKTRTLWHTSQPLETKCYSILCWATLAGQHTKSAVHFVSLLFSQNVTLNTINLLLLKVRRSLNDRLQLSLLCVVCRAGGVFPLRTADSGLCIISAAYQMKFLFICRLPSSSGYAQPGFINRASAEGDAVIHSHQFCIFTPNKGSIFSACSATWLSEKKATKRLRLILKFVER